MRSAVISSNPLDPLTTRLRQVCLKADTQGPALVDFGGLERGEPLPPADLAVVVLSPDLQRGLEALRKRRALTSGRVLAVGPILDSRVILQALHLGADHYLDENDAGLETSLNDALDRFQDRSAAAPAGRVVALLGACGGCGVSTLAVNLATTFAKDHGKVALIDLKIGRGDLAPLLDLRPSYTLADVCVNAGRLDKAMFEKVLVHHSSGVHLLASPQVFGDTRVVNAEGVQRALLMARSLFSHVVVDLEDCFHDEQVQVLKQASAILVVGRLEFTALRNLRRILQYLRDLNLPPDRVRLVINRQGQANELPPAEAEDALGREVSHTIPDDPKSINSANNAGVPVVLKYPAAKVSQAIMQTARSVLERRKAPATKSMVLR